MNTKISYFLLLFSSHRAKSADLLFVCKQKFVTVNIYFIGSIEKKRRMGDGFNYLIRIVLNQVQLHFERTVNRQNFINCNVICINFASE